MPTGYIAVGVLPTQLRSLSQYHLYHAPAQYSGVFGGSAIAGGYYMTLAADLTSMCTLDNSL